ncbi:MAG: DUF2752 domain-containing protein [candidate division KSB1 bacterium]|nr:DUF2752 domain-containing protein [candidate division KSB1 bacterium]
MAQSGRVGTSGTEGKDHGPGWILGVYSALAAGILLLSRWVDVLSAGRAWLCPFRELTGWPCPFCRGLRSVDALAHGHVWKAFGQNPLVCAAILIALVAPLFGVAFRPTPAHGYGRVAGLVVLANWIYLILSS